jgi:hypothetical protein
VAWHPNAEYGYFTASTDVVRDGRPEIVLLVKGGEEPPEGVIQLGEIELNVDSNEPLALEEDDFGLAFADVLTLPTAEGPSRALNLRNMAFEKTVTQTSFKNRLIQNYPNPFNPTTTIAFSIAKDSDVKLVVYDVAGARVRTLADGHRVANNYRLAWDGKNDAGESVASGVYFYRLTAGSFTTTKKMVLLR